MWTWLSIYTQLFTKLVLGCLAKSTDSFRKWWLGEASQWDAVHCSPISPCNTWSKLPQDYKNKQQLTQSSKKAVCSAVRVWAAAGWVSGCSIRLSVSSDRNPARWFDDAWAGVAGPSAWDALAPSLELFLCTHHLRFSALLYYIFDVLSLLDTFITHFWSFNFCKILRYSAHETQCLHHSYASDRTRNFASWWCKVVLWQMPFFRSRWQSTLSLSPAMPWAATEIGLPCSITSIEPIKSLGLRPV